MRLEGLDLTAASGVIDDSQTWADMRAANADVRESFWQALEQLAEDTVDAAEPNA